MISGRCRDGSNSKPTGLSEEMNWNDDFDVKCKLQPLESKCLTVNLAPPLTVHTILIIPHPPRSHFPALSTRLPYRFVKKDAEYHGILLSVC